ncbi:MAG TPA: PKD domain-containing protein [Bacteroidales bacterium]|nr:PKD domain-containing protein [Bacteroidales bacterium]
MGVEDCILACKGNTVQYSAVCPNASQYSWIITGASNYHFINQGQTAVVTWGYGLVGTIHVSVVVGDTNTCSAETCVFLMDSPEAHSSTVPEYYYNQEGEKVIEICLGETIEFVDMSTTIQTPITGYYWESEFGAASTKNYSLTPLTHGVFTLTHCVRNECGCENCEKYTIIVSAATVLELSCYGTVCENTTASYSLINPPCSEYVWNIEGGSMVGQGTPDITVHWGSPASGYGVIKLDASKCDTECNGLISIKIPIITANAEISGVDTVCVSEMQIYELPRWGSTQYTWYNTNDSCLNMHNGKSPNQYVLEFVQPGVVTIGANYICTFLECGYFSASPKTIIVKDTMSILSDKNTLCKGSTALFYTTHSNSVQWRIYNQNDQQIFTTNAVTLSYTFTAAGNYKITASHEDYCKVVEYHVTVLDNPPALTSTTGPSVACPGSSILLVADPTHPRYYLVWEPVCSSAMPDSVEGNEVTITFDNEVCDVAVYQVDNEYNCRSEAYIHEVETFTLLPHGLPSITTACAGSTVHFAVPDQSPNVTYEWTISPANAASVFSNDHLRPSVNILTNHLANTTPPYPVNIKIKRIYCSNIEVNETVLLSIEDVQQPILNCPDTVCENELITLTATGSTSTGSHYQWSFSDTTLIFSGTTIARKFNEPGYVYVTVTYHPNPDCNPVTVHDTIWVSSSPYANIIRNGNNLNVQSFLNSNYVWTYNGEEVSYTPTCSVVGDGTYCCTITSTITPYCSASDCYTIGADVTDTCITVSTSHTIHCNVVTVHVSDTLELQYSWSLSPSAQNSYCLPTQSSDSTTAYFNVVGNHYVKAYAELDGQCYKGKESVQINCVPAIALSYDCNGHIIVQDISQYRDGYSIPNRYITIEGTTLTAIIYPPQMSVSIPTATLPTASYTVTMTVGNTECLCSENIAYEPNPIITGINIPAKMCNKTPFLFTATTEGTITEYEWDFGDNSHNVGNNIYHTYKINESSFQYNVTLIVKNVLGCTDTSTIQINVFQDVLDPKKLGTLSDIPVCPGIPRRILFNTHASDNLYTWSLNNSPSNIHYYDALYTGNYYVTVYNTEYGCRAEAMFNVEFLTAPWAHIIGNTEYCQGETVKLYGNTGLSNTYFWDITGPEHFTFFNANISFIPSQPGIYTAVLTVNNQGQCSDTAVCTFTVNPTPAAPSIAFYGNHCIHEPPVVVHSTTGQPLLWSNGYYGTTAYSYTDGYLKAHYIDPFTGCRSLDAQIFIQPAPDFDALLTGCYRMCDEQFQYNLPVYGIYPYTPGPLNWEWILQHPYTNFPVNDQDPLLPLIDFGTYFMKANYTAGCTANSPELIIEEADICPCDSVSFKSNGTKYKISGCRLFCFFEYTVCNHGNQTLTFDNIQTNMGGNILYVNPLPIVLSPGNCENIIIEIEYTDFMSSTFEFILIDHSLNCGVSHVENVNWQSYITDNCGIFEEWVDFKHDLSTPHEAVYYQFHFNVLNAIEVLSVWSNPSQVINYTSHHSNPVSVDGLLMLDYGLLSQMAMNGESICFYVIACIDGEKLCYDSICIPPHLFMGQLPDEFRQLTGSSMMDADFSKKPQFNTIIPETDKLYLAPNPARDEVTVMGVAPDKVAEITILTMEGRQIALSRNECRFKIGHLTKASYIVRVITTDKNVHYLKLVKQ